MKIVIIKSRYSVKKSVLILKFLSFLIPFDLSATNYPRSELDSGNKKKRFFSVLLAISLRKRIIVNSAYYG